MNTYDITVIGGGSAGCMAAIAAAKNNKSVLIIEKNDKLLKKIYATGNGKCNYTNDYQDKSCYRSTCPDDAYDIVNRFDKDQTIAFFKGIGIMPKNKNGYYYPYSEQASAIAKALELEIKKYAIGIKYHTSVKKIVRAESCIVIDTDHGAIKAKKVILATGGKASPVHGSDGSGYHLAQKMGHKIINPLPALTQLKGKEKFYKTIAGVRLEARGTLYVGDTKVTDECGEFLFTAYGISGIPVFQMSRYAASALEQNLSVQLSLDFFPDIDLSIVSSYLSHFFAESSYKSAEECMHGLINSKLAYVILNGCKIDPLLSADNVSEWQIERLARKIKNFELGIIGTNGFENAQVTMGGVPLDEVELGTLESKKTSGVYFAGEILDVDGTCGGYNLQWAWSSGYIAGISSSGNNGGYRSDTDESVKITD